MRGIKHRKAYYAARKKQLKSGKLRLGKGMLLRINENGTIVTSGRI